jgi:histidine triad (HIT) family protein
VPKRHVESVLTLEPGDGPLVGRLILTAKRIGESMGFGDRGYRLAINCGPEGGQHVGHLHVHFLAGRLQERRVERR